MTRPISTQWISLSEGFKGFLATPPAGSGPGLLLCQEIFGVNEHIQAVAEQYALDGYVVLAPDLFWRDSPRVELGYEGDDRQRAFGLMQAYSLESAIADMQLSMASLRARPEVAGQRAAAIGYCMGGRMAYLAAARAGADAAVAYYGGGVHTMLDLADSIRCPMQFHFAGIDDYIPEAAVQSVRDRMGPQRADIHVYAGAHHGFNCWARASYHAPAAALARARSLGFLAQHLW